jgi:hypothetical protein
VKRGTVDALVACISGMIKGGSRVVIWFMGLRDLVVEPEWFFFGFHFLTKTPFWISERRTCLTVRQQSSFGPEKNSFCTRWFGTRRTPLNRKQPDTFQAAEGPAFASEDDSEERIGPEGDSSGSTRTESEHTHRLNMSREAFDKYGFRRNTP